MRNECKILAEKPGRKRPFERSRRRCVDNIKMVRKDVGLEGAD
jgi:hypothetical protein